MKKNKNPPGADFDRFSDPQGEIQGSTSSKIMLCRMHECRERKDAQERPNVRDDFFQGFLNSNRA
ncbi:MAG TPA: hypothetical protein VK138_12270 [Acidiferrobacterales bacterium]|nr:hypothetical protein [Acidiferrobacterales bacterium]